MVMIQRAMVISKNVCGKLGSACLTLGAKETMKVFSDNRFTTFYICLIVLYLESAGSTGSTPNRSQTPSPTSTPHNGQAWAGSAGGGSEQPAMEVSIDPGNVLGSACGGGDKDPASSSHVINLNDGLNIKGM